MFSERLRAVTVAGFVLFLSGCSHKEAGGVWGKETPPEGSIVTDSTILLDAHGYPTKETDPPIDHVDFTVFYPGVGDEWPIVCSDKEPEKDTNIYQCEGDLKNAPPGEVTITFNVCNTNGYCNYAPHGERHINYQPED